MVIPFSFLFIFPLDETVELKTDNNSITIDKDAIFKPSGLNAIRSIFSTPFDLEWYNICIEDFGTTPSYSGLKDFRWIVEYPQKNATLERNSTICELVKLDQKVTLQLSMDFSPHELPPPEPFKNISIMAYAKPEESGLIAKNILFILTVWGVILLLKGILDLVFVNTEAVKS